MAEVQNDPEYNMFQYSFDKGTVREIKGIRRRQGRIPFSDQELTFIYQGLKVTTPVTLMEAKSVLTEVL
jgi:hypothetical protein